MNLTVGERTVSALTYSYTCSKEAFPVTASSSRLCPTARCPFHIYEAFCPVEPFSKGLYRMIVLFAATDAYERFSDVYSVTMQV